MLPRQEIFNALMDLDFSMLDASKPLFHQDIEAVILDEGQGIIASSPLGRHRIAVTSVKQLEDDLARLLGYQRPINGFF